MFLIELGRLFQAMNAATGDARSPRVERRVDEIINDKLSAGGDGHSLRWSGGGSRQGMPELSREDSGGQGHTTETGYARGLTASGDREAELCALISWLRRPTEQRHSEPTVTYPLGDQ